jgi:hypothetical protein
LTVIVIFPEVIAVDPVVTTAGLVDALQSVFAVGGSDSVVVVGVQVPTQVIGLLAVRPLEASVAATVPAAVASHAKPLSTGRVLVKAPPATSWQIGFGSETQSTNDALAVTDEDESNAAPT